MLRIIKKQNNKQEIINLKIKLTKLINKEKKKNKITILNW